MQIRHKKDYRMGSKVRNMHRKARPSRYMLPNASHTAAQIEHGPVLATLLMIQVRGALPCKLNCFWGL
jgi:hypothetical protein